MSVMFFSRASRMTESASNAIVPNAPGGVPNVRMKRSTKPVT
jgi:hypothetical protein